MKTGITLMLLFFVLVSASAWASEPTPQRNPEETMKRIAEVKLRITSLHQELGSLYKELDGLLAATPPPPSIQPPPYPIYNPDANYEQVAQLKRAIEKWTILLNDPGVSDDEKIRAKKEIEILMASYHKLMMTPEKPAPYPCLGAYSDQNGPLQNPCGVKEFKPLPPPGSDFVFNGSGFPRPEPPKPPVRPETQRPPVKPEPPKPPVKPETQRPPVKPEPPKPTVKPESQRPPVKPELPKPPVKPESQRPPVKPEPPKPTVKPESQRPPVKPELPKPTVKPESQRPPVKPELPKPTVKPESQRPQVKPEPPKPKVKPAPPHNLLSRNK